MGGLSVVVSAAGVSGHGTLSAVRTVVVWWSGVVCMTVAPVMVLPTGVVIVRVAVGGPMAS